MASWKGESSKVIWEFFFQHECLSFSNWLIRLKSFFGSFIWMFCLHVNIVMHSSWTIWKLLPSLWVNLSIFYVQRKIEFRNIGAHRLFHSIVFQLIHSMHFLKARFCPVIPIGKRQHSITNTNCTIICHQAILVVVYWWWLSLSESLNKRFTPIRWIHAFNHRLHTHTHLQANTCLSTLRQLTNDVRKIRCVILDLTFECSVFIAQRS